MWNIFWIRMKNVSLRNTHFFLQQCAINAQNHIVMMGEIIFAYKEECRSLRLFNDPPLSLSLKLTAEILCFFSACLKRPVREELWQIVLVFNYFHACLLACLLIIIITSLFLLEHRVVRCLHDAYTHSLCTYAQHLSLSRHGPPPLTPFVLLLLPPFA